MDGHRLAHAQPTAEKRDGFGSCEPLGDGIGKRRYIKWKNLGEQELIETVNRIVAEKGIRSMRQMKEDDSSMFRAVKERGLGERVSFPVNGAGKAHSGKEPEMKKAEPEEAEGETHARGPEEAGGNGGAGFTAKEAAELAQLVIDEKRLRGMDGLVSADPELAEAVRESGAGGMLVFATDETEKGGNGAASRAPREGTEITEQEMYRRICEECFRVNGGNPFLGNRRGTIPKLQSALKRRLSGPEHRLFRKCWDRMEAEGAIVYNSNKSAASLDLHCEPRTAALREALRLSCAQRPDPAQNAHV